MSKGLLILLASFCRGGVFSLLLLTAGCGQKKEAAENGISVIWKDGRATGISISKSRFSNILQDSLHTQLEVRLAKHGRQPAITGEYILTGNEIIFEPLLPFTRGLRYEIFVQHQLYAVVDIATATDTPELLAVYPSCDSLPENLLKMYLVFSRPMLEGHSLQYIKLTGDKGDSLPNTFLDTRPELWNTQRTMLTLWLDPGRIKRDLPPNKLLGPPLIKGKKYNLVISADWPNQQGATLGQAYTKKFTAAVRDTVSPLPGNWKLTPPVNGTKQPLEVDFGEPLDYMLVLNAIRLIDGDGNIVNGEVQTGKEEMKYYFIPAAPWLPGLYKLQIEARLEDLAGNNINRLFDLDLQNPGALQPAKNIFEREWRIK